MFSVLKCKKVHRFNMKVASNFSLTANDGKLKRWHCLEVHSFWKSTYSLTNPMEKSHDKIIVKYLEKVL